MTIGLAFHIMQCLTSDQCSGWLRERGIQESPYSRSESRSELLLQFEASEKTRDPLTFTRVRFDAFGKFPGALVVFNDRSLCSPDEMALIQSLRRGSGEERWLADPG